MHLTKLTISGFKSFAERTNLAFDRGVTAIVGPNGSGKSNIVDAIRWALGEQSKKSLRGKRGEDIIFSGSNKKAAMGMASVALTLENTTRKVSLGNKKEAGNPILFSEINLKRKIYKNGDGEYFLNNSKVRLKEIEQVLAQSGMSQKNYIIGQGMIERIIALSAQEKKELFLEASQIKPLTLKREEAKRKLDLVHNNLERVKGLILEIEPHLKRLKKQAILAEKQDKIKKSLRALQKVWYHKNLQRLIEELAETREGRERIEEKMQVFTNEIQKLKLEIKENYKLYEKLSQANQDLRIKERRILQAKNILVNQIAALTGKLEIILEHRNTPKGREEERREGEIQNLAQMILRLKSENQNLEEQFHAREEKIGKIDQELKELGENSNMPIAEHQIEEKLRSLVKVQEEILMEFQKPIKIHDIKNQIEGVLALMRDLLLRFKATRNEKINLKQKTKKEKLNEQRSDLEIKNKSLASNLRIMEEKISFLYFQKQSLEEGKARGEKQEPTLQNNRTDTDAMEAEIKILRQKMQAEEEKAREIALKIENLIITEEEGKQRIFQIESELRKNEEELIILKDKRNEIIILDAKNNLQKENLYQESIRELGQGWDKLDDIKKTAFLEEVNNFEKKINQLKNKLAISGSIDITIIQEYKETNNRFEFLNNESNDLEQASGSLLKLVLRLNRTIEARFKHAFCDINLAFRDYCRILFNGGRANLALDQGDGIEIIVSPPGKRIKSLQMLSGGEKSLVGLALIFSIISMSHPPFCVLDEVDAALDEANSRCFAKILAKLAPSTQFIAITHNRETMKAAKVLYGVTMRKDGVSKLLSMKLED